MRMLFALLFLTLWTSAAQAGCPEQAAAVKACFAFWDEEFARRLIAIPPPNIHTSQALIASARIYNRRMYDSAVTIRDCIRRGERLENRCGGPARDLVDGVKRELEPYAGKMISVQDQTRSKIAAYIAAANAMNGSISYMLTCHMRAANKGGFQICFVVDRSSSEHEFIPDSRESELPLTVGATSGCTFFVDDRGRMLSADHCGQEHMTRAFLFGAPTRPIHASRTNHLQFNPVNFEIGPAIEDIAVFAPSTRGMDGRSFYYLALDRKLIGKACEYRQQNILACSSSALLSLSGSRAEMLSFPAPYYAGVVRESPRSVMRTRGTLTYDRNFERFFVQMYAQEGASGAPVYLPAQTLIGDLLVDKPVVIGPLTGISGSPGPMYDSKTDNIGVIAAVRYDRMARVLGAPQDQFAGWILRSTLP